MGRYLVINDEQQVLHLLFSSLTEDRESLAVDFAATVEEAKRLAGKNSYDRIILQVGPASPVLNGHSMEDFVATVAREVPAGDVVWVTNFEGTSGTSSFGSSDFVVSGSLLRHLITDGGRGKERENTALRGSVVALANVFQSIIDLEDPYLKGDLHFMVECSRELAVALNLSGELVAAIEIAASLYDIGKIGLNKELLWKKTSLDHRQKDLIHTHPLLACDMLKDVPFPWDVIPIVKHHHERFDGSGYPDGLKGRQIPVGARILAVVDAFHAMISRRPYRRGLEMEEAFAEIGRNAGIQFDPEVVEAFFGVGRDYFERNPTRRAFTALLVDDSLKDLSRLKMALELEGYEVFTARTFRQADAAVEGRPPDLIISELCLADGDGFDFLDRLRERKELEDTVFMFLSSRNAHEDRVEAYRKGVDDFLGKPYQVGELVLKLGNILRRVRKRQESAPKPAKSALVGTLAEFSLPDLLQILDFGVKTALVTVSNGATAGRIFVEKGKVKYALLDSLTGQDALMEMFGWPEGGFSIEHGVSIDKKNVSMESPALILDTLRRLDERKRNDGGGNNGGNSRGSRETADSAPNPMEVRSHRL